MILAALAGCSEQVSEGKDCPAAVKARSLSGFCVPRWVSLKRGEVIARKGPDKDYPPVWVYHAKGLPVQVVAETEDWRRICDAERQGVWVHRSMVDGRRLIMPLGPGPAVLHKAASAESPTSGLLNARALAALEACKGDWCKVKADGISGWTPAAALWGVAVTPQCH